MQQVDFYLINNQVTQAEFKLASRLANKLLSLKQRVLLVTETESDAADLDQMLWTFNDTSFVAHDRVPAKKNVYSSIHVAVNSDVNEATLKQDYTVLINLSKRVPSYHQRFSRIAEIIAADEPAKAAGRTRYKAYKSNNIEIKTHPIEI